MVEGDPPTFLKTCGDQARVLLCYRILDMKNNHSIVLKAANPLVRWSCILFRA